MLINYTYMKYHLKLIVISPGSLPLKVKSSPDLTVTTMSSLKLAESLATVQKADASYLTRSIGKDQIWPILTNLEYKQT